MDQLIKQYLFIAYAGVYAQAAIASYFLGGDNPQIFYTGIDNLLLIHIGLFYWRVKNGY